MRARPRGPNPSVVAPRTSVPPARRGMVRNRRGIALRTRCRSGSAAAMAATARTASSSFSPGAATSPTRRRRESRARLRSRRVRAARRYTPSPPPQPPPRNPRRRTTVREGTPSLNQPRERDHRYLHRRRPRRRGGLDENRRVVSRERAIRRRARRLPTFRARAFDENDVHPRVRRPTRRRPPPPPRPPSRVGVRRGRAPRNAAHRDATSGSSGAAGARFATTLNAR